MTQPSPPKKDPADRYTIGWICALDSEYMCACRMLDEELPPPDLFRNARDENTYVFGRLGNHYIVVTCLPGGQRRSTTATHVARDMAHTFPKLEFALAVGLAGGAPTAENDVRLGDVVVGAPGDGIPAVVDLSLEEMLPGGRLGQAQGTPALNGPPERLLRAIPEMRRRYRDLRLPDAVARHLERLGDMDEYLRPESDKLYHPDYAHVRGTGAGVGAGCEHCHDSFTVKRPKRKDQRLVQVHYGTIGSGSTPLRDATLRDQYANDPAMNILCFDTISADLTNTVPCLAIRGISNYCDSHANGEWDKYAALAAAAYARELLLTLPAPHRVESMLPEYGEVVQGPRNG
ncbi:purine and uridine phosphorylase [Aspergillus carlsbadensis]|nr:purine and uridine phosphorylase [Aspergillus carlsbadensis]